MWNENEIHYFTYLACQAENNCCIVGAQMANWKIALFCAVHVAEELFLLAITWQEAFHRHRANAHAFHSKVHWNMLQTQ